MPELAGEVLDVEELGELPQPAGAQVAEATAMADHPPRTPPREAAALGRRLPPLGAAAGVAQAQPAAATDVSMGAISMPAAAVRRIVRSAAPGIRFNSEAIAAVHRVAQAFACYATDRCVKELRGTLTLAGPKTKGKVVGGGSHPAKKTLGAEHVMKVLSKELPPVATKISALFPELVPQEYRPQEIKLLELMHEQERAAQERERAAAERAAAADEARERAAGLPAQTAAGLDPALDPDFDPAFGAQAFHDPAEDDPAFAFGIPEQAPMAASGGLKRPAGEAASEEVQPPVKKQAGASLSGMFNRQKAVAAQA